MKYPSCPYFDIIQVNYENKVIAQYLSQSLQISGELQVAM